MTKEEIITEIDSIIYDTILPHDAGKFIVKFLEDNDLLKVTDNEPSDDDSDKYCGAV